MSRLGALATRLANHGSRVCFVEGDGEQSYGALCEAVAAWKATLSNMGIGQGTVVALRSDFCLDSTALLLALFELKAVAVLVPSHRDALALIRQCSSEWLCELMPGEPVRWQKLDGSRRPRLLRVLADRNDGGIVIFTTGSSGKPKAALQSVERFLAKYDRPGRHMRTLPFLLFDHIAGMDTLFYTISNGGTLVPTRRRDPQSILDLIHTREVEVLPASPSFLRLLCLEGADSRHYPSLKVITYGSEPMDPATLARLNSRFPNVQLAQKYGTTETGSPRSVSRANDSLWLRLRDDKVETRVTDGVLWIRGESTILGYLNAPSPLDAQGWVCTGDRVETDGDWIRFQGRDGDVINVGGEKVMPTEVEQVILELDFVKEAVVLGEPHPLMGQIVIARVLVPGRESEEAIRSIRTHCAARLERYKVPVKIEVASASSVGERQKAMRTAEGGVAASADGAAVGARRQLNLKSPLLVSALTFAAAGVGFVLATLIFGRQLPQDEFGEAVLIIATCLSAVHAAPAGINALVVRYDLATGLPILRVATALGAAFASLACLAAFLIYGITGPALLVIAATVLVGSMALGAMSGLQRMQQFGRATLLSQSANIGLLAAALIMLTGVGLTSWFPAVLAAMALALTGTLAWLWVLRSPQTGAALEARLWKRGVNFGGLAVTAELMAQIERFLIPLLLTYRDLAHFAVVAAIALAPFRVLEMGALSTLAPRLRKEKGWAKRRRLLLTDLILLAGFTTLAGSAVLAVGPWICSIFLPTLEFPSAILTAVMVSGYGRVLVALSKGIASAFGTAGEISRVHAIGWISLGVSVLGGIALSGFGLTGVIYGIAIGWLFQAAAIFWLSASHLRSD